MSVLFCNVGWMKRYCGLHAGDEILGGGAWVNEHGHGLEACNFLDHEGTTYGFVKSPGDAINLEKIAQNGMALTVDSDIESIEGVLVVWTAPLRGHAPTVVVGWYRDATVYRRNRKFRSTPSIHKRNRVDVYRFKTKSKNAVLLPVATRTLEITRFQAGLMGRANIWYADTREGESVVREVRNLVRRAPRRRLGRRRSTDPEHNAKVEREAVRQVRRHYCRRGYVVDSVETDNLVCSENQKGTGRWVWISWTRIPVEKPSLVSRRLPGSFL
ncbi:MAG: hypothetical protein OXJ64_09195 [Boseongicola sp.]|nr:hypothetical protein [Boseongicola sp.]